MSQMLKELVAYIEELPESVAVKVIVKSRLVKAAVLVLGLAVTEKVRVPLFQESQGGIVERVTANP